MSLGIQHTTLAIQGLCDVAVLVVKIAKNGVSFSDVFGFAGKIQVLRKLFEDFPETSDELKDLDAAEMQKLAILATEAVGKIALEVAKKPK